MKYYILMIVLLIFCPNSKGQYCPNDNEDEYFITTAHSLFCKDIKRFHFGLGKYIFGTNSAFTAEYLFRKEPHYSFSQNRKYHTYSHHFKLGYIYSLRFCGPLYLNPGISVLIGKGKEQIDTQRKFVYGGELSAEIEGRCFDAVSLYLEPCINYSFKARQNNISLSGGIKIYLN